MAAKKDVKEPPKRATAADPPPFRPPPGYLPALILAWLVPGLGHWVLGQRVRAVVLGLPLLGIFWWGEAQARGYAVHRREHPIFFYGQIGNGLSAILADRWQDEDAVKPEPPQGQIDVNIPPGLPAGILLTSISGLLNLVLVFHLLDPRTWEERRGRARGDPAPGGGRRPPAAGSPPGGPERQGGVR